MSKRLYDHLISTNYANISNKVQKEKKKSKPLAVSKGNNS